MYLYDIFINPYQALPVFQDWVREALHQRLLDPQGRYSVDRDWLNGGTSEWQHFASFKFTDDYLEVLFPPYQVAAYALGPHVVPVPYELLVPLMAPQFIEAMSLERFVRST